MPDDLEKWQNTALEVIEKALKRTADEAVQAAIFASLISLQLGMLLSFFYSICMCVSVCHYSCFLLWACVCIIKFGKRQLQITGTFSLFDLILTFSICMYCTESNQTHGSCFIHRTFRRKASSSVVFRNSLKLEQPNSASFIQLMTAFYAKWIVNEEHTFDCCICNTYRSIEANGKRAFRRKPLKWFIILDLGEIFWNIVVTTQHCAITAFSFSCFGT